MTKTESIKENGNDKVREEKKQRLRNKHTAQWAYTPHNLPVIFIIVFLQRYCKIADCHGWSRHQSHLTNSNRERIIWSPAQLNSVIFVHSCHLPCIHQCLQLSPKQKTHWRCYSTNSNICIRQERHQHLLRPFLTHCETTQVHATHMTKLSFMSQPWHQLFCKALSTDLYTIQPVAHRRNPTPQLSAEHVVSITPWKNNTSLTDRQFILSVDSWPQKKKKNQRLYISFCVSLCPYLLAQNYFVQKNKAAPTDGICCQCYFTSTRKKK